MAWGSLLNNMFKQKYGLNRNWCKQEKQVKNEARCQALWLCSCRVCMYVYMWVFAFFLYVLLFMVELRQWTDGTEQTKRGLESAASFAMQSAGFQLVVRHQPANLLLQAGAYTVPKRDARQNTFLCLIWSSYRLNALSHKAPESWISIFFSWNSIFDCVQQCSVRILK